MEGFFKLIKKKINASNSITLLLDGSDRMDSNNSEKTDVINKCFYSGFGKKLDAIFIILMMKITIVKKLVNNIY